MQERPRRSLSLFHDLFFRPTILLSLILSSPLLPSSHLFISPSNIFPFCVLPLTRFFSFSFYLSLSLRLPSRVLSSALSLSLPQLSALSLSLSLTICLPPSFWFSILDS
jgi:hypothetical protein